MTLVQKLINGTEYYTDDKVYYTFHQVKLPTDTLWAFACTDLGITKKIGFTSEETKKITDLAGIGPRYPTKFLLLKSGDAVPVPYLADSGSNLHPDDIILLSVVDPTIAKPINPSITAVVSSSVSTKSVADRLEEIEDLHNRKLLTDLEYKAARGKIIAGL